MQKRVLGRTGLEVSAIGCGGIPIRRAEIPEAVRVLQKAVDLGINYFDTARGYEGSETRVGLAFQGRRDKVIIASKSRGSTEDMLQRIEESLKALRTDYIDIYEVHGAGGSSDTLEKALASGGPLEGIEKAKQQGKVRFTGMSGHRPDILAQAIKTGRVGVILVPFNFVNDLPAKELFPVAKEYNVGVTIMKPIGGSLFQHPDLCLRWILEHDAVSTICVGMWKESEMEQNAAVGRNPRPLNDEEREWLRLERLRWERCYCRLCYTCNPCPLDVPVRSLIIVDLDYRRLGLKTQMDWGLKEWLEAVKKCETCEVCQVKCAYDMPIRELMLDARRRYLPIVEAYK